MKLKLTLAAAALCLLGSSMARAADPLTLLNFGTPTLLPDGTYGYSGQVSNPSTTDSFLLNGTSITGLPADVTFTDFIGDLTLGDLPLTLGPQGSQGEQPFFALTIPGGTGHAAFQGTYTLNGHAVGATTGDVALVTASFFFPTAPVVPEPGSMALLMGSVVSGGLFLARRRRK